MDGAVVAVVQEIAEELLVLAQGVGKHTEVLLQEQARFGMAAAVRADIARVVVPIEQRLLLLLQGEEERLFHLVDDIEAHKGHVLHAVGQGNGALLQGFGHFAVESALVRLARGGQVRRQCLVNREEVFPQPVEVLSQVGQLVLGKVVEEALQLLDLFRREVVETFQAAVVAQVAEHLACVGPALVHVVEVGQ